jgi:peptidoglycan hydrolase CwlO-like protein
MGDIMNEIIFVKKQQVIDFLKARSIEDHEIKWTCPSCGTINLGAYYSHSSPCGGCNKFIFPRLNLKEVLKDDNEATEIAKEIKSFNARIERQWDIIEELEDELSSEKRKLDELKDELKTLKSCNMSKVKAADW